MGIGTWDSMLDTLACKSIHEGNIGYEWKISGNVIQHDRKEGKMHCDEGLSWHCNIT